MKLTSTTVGWPAIGGDFGPEQVNSYAGRYYLSFAERGAIALWRAQGHGVREIAWRLGRAASTLSRELRRSAAPRTVLLRPCAVFLAEYK